MSQLRIVEGDVVELDGVPIARLEPGLPLSQRDRLIAAFDSLDDAEDFEDLEEKIEELKKTISAYERRFAMLKSGFPRTALGEAAPEQKQ